MGKGLVKLIELYTGICTSPKISNSQSLEQFCETKCEEVCGSLNVIRIRLNESIHSLDSH